MIDGTREGEMDTAYMLGVDEAGNRLVVVECMCRGDRDLKVGFIDENAAIMPWHDGMAAMAVVGAYLISCVGSQRISERSAQEGSSHHLFHHHITVRLAGAHLLSIWPYDPN